MEKLPMCRVCLAVNVRMYVVVNKNLHELYERLTDNPFITQDNRPMLACFFCCTKLKQCCQFQRKCLEAEQLFVQMMNEDYEPKPLINQDHCFNGFIQSPMVRVSVPDECQTESDDIKEELPAVCEEPNDIIEPKEEHLSDDLELENLNSSYSDIDLEDDLALMEIKTEVEEEKVESKKTQRSSDMQSTTGRGSEERCGALAQWCGDGGAIGVASLEVRNEAVVFIGGRNVSLKMTEEGDRELCVLCKKPLIVGFVKVTQKGLEKIRQSSRRRDDGLFPQLMEVSNLTVHVKCRKAYINDAMIKAFKRKKTLFMNATASDPLASNIPPLEFNFQSKCLICGNDTADNSKFRQIKMPHTKKSLKTMAISRNDLSGETVLRRIQDVDLVAVGARYHISCYDTFRLTVLRPSAEQRKRGRPEADFTISAMEEIYRHIEENGDECQFSLTELKYCVTNECPDDRAIIKKLKEKYGDKLIISKVDGKPILFCFRDTSSKILHEAEAWQTGRSSDDKDEKLKIIRTAICNDCHGKPCTGSITIDDNDESDEDETAFEQMLTCCSKSGQPHDSDMNEDEPIISASDDLSIHVAITDDDKENLEEASCSKRLRY